MAAYIIYLNFIYLHRVGDKDGDGGKYWERILISYSYFEKDDLQVIFYSLCNIMMEPWYHLQVHYDDDDDDD